MNDNCASPGLISVDDAITRILDAATPLQSVETVNIESALGRVLAEDITSSINVPGYDNSAMDGYVVNSKDCQQRGMTLAVSQRIPAGTTGDPLEAGTAARIFTGAPVPENANAVVMQELCEQQGNNVVINTIVKAGENVRRAGEDIARDAVVLDSGTRLRPQDMGLLASVGVAQVNVYRKLKVATFFTGDEIVEPGNELASGQIYNSNQYTLAGLLQSVGCDVVNYGIVPDTLDNTLAVMSEATSNADLVLTSGGVSVGEEDYVRIALEQLGQLNMWRIAMKPGKPVAFGQIGDCLFMGLPGNPVSVFVTFLIFARPLILKLQGANRFLADLLTIRSDFSWKKVKREEYLRVKIKQAAEGPVAELYPHQGSGVLSSASWADGLVVVEIDTQVKKGDLLPYIPFQGLF